MKRLTQEWVHKAEDDFGAVTTLSRSRTRKHHDAVCFHCQQCVEKYLKARLQEATIPFPKTHDLPALLRMVSPVEPSWVKFDAAMRILTDYSIDPRYPGLLVNSAKAKEAVKLCRSIRRACRAALRLPP